MCSPRGESVTKTQTKTTVSGHKEEIARSTVPSTELSGMSDQIKLDENGDCPTCVKASADGEHVECYGCSGLFHAICGGTPRDAKVANKTTVDYFLLPSTKRNFVFFCDRCLTKNEIQQTETNKGRIDNLEDKMSTIDKQLEDIKKMLLSKGSAQVEAKLPNDNLWANKERLATVRAPEPKARLIISKGRDSEVTHKVIERVLVENEIPLAESHQNKEGDLVLTCETETARNELQDFLRIASHDIAMSAPKAKQQSITIVGLPNEYSKEEALRCIITQNEFIKQFSVLNKIEDHINIHVIKPLRNKPTVFQVFASVSPVLREGLQYHKDRIIIGFMSCKIYDRQQVMRCNNCQHFGHFARNCPTQDEPVCGKCSESHRTDSCDKNERKCINCVRNGNEDDNHSVLYHGCPSVVKQLELKSKSLNSLSRGALQQT